MISGLKTGVMPKLSGAGQTASAKFERTSPAAGFSGGVADDSKDGGFAERLAATERPSERPARPVRDNRREDDQKVRASGTQPAVPHAAPQPAPQTGMKNAAAPESEETAAGEVATPESVNRPVARAAKGSQGGAQANQQADAGADAISDEGETVPDISKALDRGDSRQALGANGLPAANENFKTLARPQLQETAVAAEDAVAQAQEAQVQVRRQAMQNFMSRMQNEFGIPPEKIVDAFARMDEASLTRPPEESAQQFLANLEVPRAQQGKAAEIYHQMLNTTGEAALNEKIIGRESGLQMRVLSPREEALRKLNESIDQLNDAFAMRNPKVMVSPSAPMDSMMKAQLAAEQMNTELLKMERDSRTGGAQAGENSDDSGALFGASVESEGSSAGAASAGLGGGAIAAGMGGFEAMNNGAGNANDWQGPSKRAPAQNSMIDNSSSVNSRFKMPTLGESGHESSKTTARKPLSDTSALATSGEAAATSADANTLAGATNAMPGAEKAAAPTGPAAMMINRPTPTAQDEKDNVKELIRQAQLAVKKGGGEIKMDLKPEGMGQIKLKVSVENGQVSVQMLTESDAAKRLLEKGLHELKSNLAAEQLKVDTMKVDVGQELQKHMDNGADQSREQTRQFASDVMSQMRDQRQAFQQGFMENRGWRQYPRGNDGGADTGVERASRGGSVNPSDARNRARRADAGRLDLVA